MPLREVQSPMYYDQEAKYKEEDAHLSTSPIPPQTSPTGNIITSPSRKKPQSSSRLSNPPGQTVDSFS
jgi:hypothetical protein